MRYRRLGRTDFQVSEIGMGGLFLAAEGIDRGIEIVQHAVERGINLFDTAPSYVLGKGRPYTQEVLGRALEGIKEEHFVSTKIGPCPIHEKPRYDYDGIMEQLEHNLKQLRRDTIDILHIHDPDRYGDPGNPGNYRAVFGKKMALETLQGLKSQGVIGAIGLASLWLDYQAYCIDKGVFDVIVTFNRYGLIWRDAQFQTFPFCRRHDVGIIQGTPFHQGVLAVPHQEWIENPPEWMNALEHSRYSRLLDIQRESGLSLPELALRFLLANPHIGVVIQGAANVEQLDQNLASSEKGPLPEDLYQDIESLGILHEDPRRYI